jgi:hypothetical protein
MTDTEETTLEQALQEMVIVIRAERMFHKVRGNAYIDNRFSDGIIAKLVEYIKSPGKYVTQKNLESYARALVRSAKRRRF